MHLVVSEDDVDNRVILAEVEQDVHVTRQEEDNIACPAAVTGLNLYNNCVTSTGEARQTNRSKTRCLC